MEISPSNKVWQFFFFNMKLHTYLWYTPSNHICIYVCQEVKTYLVHTKTYTEMFTVALPIIWTNKNNPNVLRPGDE